MKLPYTNKEIATILQKNRWRLPDHCIYYFSTSAVSGLQKNLLPDDAVTPFRALDLTFRSARHCRALLSYAQMKKMDREGWGDKGITEVVIRGDRIMSKIMGEERPNGAMAIARPFISKLPIEWVDIIRLISYRYKFLSNKEMTKLLASTEGSFLCYAHINDRVEGIYRSPAQMSGITDIREWKGENRAGRTLMMVRDELSSMPFHNVIPSDGRPVKILIRLFDNMLFNMFLDTLMRIMRISKGCIEFEKKEDDLVTLLYYIDRDKRKQHRVTSLIRALSLYPGLEVIHWED